MKQLIITCILIVLQFSIFAQDQPVIQLPQPQLEKGRPLMQVLSDRQSNRNFSERELPQQELANLLWAANGVNRKDANKRTAPTAMNRQEIEVFVSSKDGLFRYDARQHALITIHNRDIRSVTGMQGFVASAPLNLIIVADLDKMSGKELQEKMQTAYIDAGYVSQNIYLYCASENLATVVRAMVDREKLAVEMGLGKNFHIVVAQTVGYPGESH